MELELSPINVVEYQILRSNFEVIDLDNPRAASSDMDFTFNASDPTRRDDGVDYIESVLEFHIAPSKDSPSGFNLDVTVRGIFAAIYTEKGGSFEEFTTFMRVNAFTLLYAFIRSHVQILTSMSPSGQICLPCLDTGSIADTISKPPTH